MARSRLYPGFPSEQGWQLEKGTTRKAKVWIRWIVDDQSQSIGKMVVQREAHAWRALVGYRFGKEWSYDSIGEYPSATRAMNGAIASLSLTHTPHPMSGHYGPEGVGRNPGARWHDSKQREADQLDRAATKKWQQDFYHGKSVAHSESALAAKSMGMNEPRNRQRRVSLDVQKQNPRRLRETLAARYRPGKGLELSWGNEARLSPPRIRFVASRGWVDIRQSFASPEDWEQVVADAMQHPNTWAKRSASLTNPRRPHGTFRSCVRQVSRQRPRARDPKAVCGATLSRKYPLAQWEKDVRKTKKMPPFQPRPGRYRTRKNPIAIYGLGNPRLNGRINAKIEGVIYNRVVEVKAQKTGYQPGYYRHTFSRKNQVKIFGLDNGDLLLHSTAGVKLWQPD